MKQTNPRKNHFSGRFFNLKRIGLILFLVVVWLGVNPSTQAQVPQDSQESTESIALVDSTGAKFPLERTVLNLLGAGIFRTKSAYRINGIGASLRIKESSTLKFEVDGKTPPTQIRLFRLTADPNGRILILSRGKATGGRSLQQIPSIPFSLTEGNGSTTNVQPGQKLPQGEYGFLLGSGDVIFCFAIEKN